MRFTDKYDTAVIAAACRHFNLTLEINSPSCDRNEAACAFDFILLGEFDDRALMLVAAAHEIGHTRRCTQLQQYYCRICANPTDYDWFKLRYYREYRAWRWGLKAMRRIGYHITPEQLTYANSRLATYASTSEYGTRPDNFVELILS